MSANTALPGWQALLTPRGLGLLESVANSLSEGKSAEAVGAQLRREGIESDEVAALLTQADLRHRATSKFGPIARHMLFTRAGLEQATRWRVAEHHAKRFRAAGCETVADLGAGIGTESMALVAAGVGVQAVELDPFTAAVAQHNLGVASDWHSSKAPAEVVIDNAVNVDLAPFDGAFLDPARRTAGHTDTRRLTSPDDFSPSLNFAFDVADTLPTGVKLGPGTDRSLIPQQTEAQWVSVDGQVVEMSLWFGRVARPGIGRSALVIHGETAHELAASGDSPDTDVQALGEYLYEPDGAVIRARLIGKLAGTLDAGLLSSEIAYLTAPRYIETPFASAFRIIDTLPAKEKQLRRALAERGIGRLEIKKRGMNVDPARLRTQLKLRGDAAATLVLTRVDGRHTALLVERLSAPAPQ